MKNSLTVLEKKLGIKFKNPALLKIALTHRSYLNENRVVEREHNERFEFLGDAALELLVSRYLFDTCPERPEGELTSFRAATVRTESLAETAQELGYGKYIYMSKGEEATGGRERPYILANTFEAVLGAIYLDQGLRACDKFLKRVLFPKIPEIIEKRLDIDNKSKLQELAQEAVKITPTYEVASESGPDHEREFEMRVMVEEHEFGRGEGHSKQEAEQNAAAQALENWDKLVKKHFQIDV